jgi:hypothetical protein
MRRSLKRKARKGETFPHCAAAEPHSGARFIQNWQTPKPPNKCYQVRMTAIDGSHIDAYFKTK